MMYPADAVTRLWGERKLWSFHSITDDSPAIKRLKIWKKWTPSSAAHLGERHTIEEFTFNVKAHGDLLFARKPWVCKHSGFRCRTHPEEYK